MPELNRDLREEMSSQIRTGKGMFDWGPNSCGKVIEGLSLNEMKTTFDELAEVFGQEANLYLQTKPIRALSVIERIEGDKVTYYTLLSGYMMDCSTVCVALQRAADLTPEQHLKLGKIMGSYQKE